MMPGRNCYKKNSRILISASRALPVTPVTYSLGGLRSWKTKNLGLVSDTCTSACSQHIKLGRQGPLENENLGLKPVFRLLGLGLSCLGFRARKYHFTYRTKDYRYLGVKGSPEIKLWCRHCRHSITCMTCVIQEVSLNIDTVGTSGNMGNMNNNGVHTGDHVPDLCIHINTYIYWVLPLTVAV